MITISSKHPLWFGDLNATFINLTYRQMKLKFEFNSVKQRYYASNSNSLFVADELPTKDTQFIPLPNNGSDRTVFVVKGKEHVVNIDVKNIKPESSRHSDELPKELLEGLGL